MCSRLSTREAMARDYYKVLEVAASASEREIRYAYRRLSKRYGADAETGDRRAAAELTIVNDAYRTLSDAQTRREYDAALMEARDARKETLSGMTAKAAAPVAQAERPLTALAPAAPLDWSAWERRGFSVAPGRMPLWLAAALALAFDRVYRYFLVEAAGSETASAVYFGLFLFGAAACPFAAHLRGRNWFLWGVLGFGAGITAIVSLAGNPLSHAALLTLLLARPAKPPCPNCRRRVERGARECPGCRVDLGEQPL